MERKRLDQTQVAGALGVSRSAVNAWVNDRAWPMNSLGALEELLGVSLDGQPEPELISPGLRRQIREELGDDAAARVIGVLEGTLVVTEPDGEPGEARQRPAR